MTQQPQFGQPQQGFGPPQGQPQQAPTAPVTTNESGAFFAGMGSPGEVVPSHKFQGVNTGIQGRIVSCQQVAVNKFGTSEPVIDARTGQPAVQLKIVLQTEARQWGGVAKIPTNEDGSAKAPHLDNGERAIYTGGKSSKGNSWMSSALQDALAAAGRTGAMEIGAMLGVWITELVPTNEGNPYAKYGAKYASPGGQPQQQQPNQGAGAFQGYQPPAQPQQGAQGNPWDAGAQQDSPPPF